MYYPQKIDGVSSCSLLKWPVSRTRPSKAPWLPNPPVTVATPVPGVARAGRRSCRLPRAEDGWKMRKMGDLTFFANDMYIYIYQFLNVHPSLCIHITLICIYIYVCIHMYTYICIYVLFIYLYTSIAKCSFFMHTYNLNMYLSIYIYVLIHMYTYICIHTYVYTHMYTYI